MALVRRLPYETVTTCEHCEQGERRSVRRAKVAERQDKVVVILGVPMEECPACGQRWLDWEVAHRLDELIQVTLAGGAEVATRHFEDLSAA